MNKPSLQVPFLDQETYLDVGEVMGVKMIGNCRLCLLHSKKDFNLVWGRRDHLVRGSAC